MLTAKWFRHCFAGVWFAAAAAIPVGFYFLIDPLSSGRIYKVATIVGPIISAGIAGALIGARILDEKKIRSAGRAVLCGLLTSGASYILFFVLEVWAAVLYNRDAGGEGIFRLIYTIAIMFAIGFVVLGWLIALVGAAAGRLLYIFQNRSVEDGTVDPDKLTL